MSATPDAHPGSRLDFDFDEAQTAVCAAIERCCDQFDTEQLARDGGAADWRGAWQAIADLGVFAAAAPGYEDAGGAALLCAICETLGHALAPGPIAATYMAAQVVDAAGRDALIDGRVITSLSRAGSDLLPFGLDADLFLVATPDGIARADRPADIAAVATLGGECWGRGVLTPGAALPDSARALLIGDIATAAMLTGLGWRLLRSTSEYTATRKQFGRTLGEFQAVAHPLADCAIALTGAQLLARAAACDIDLAENAHDIQIAGQRATAAVLTARRAALSTAYSCHQAFGAIGVTLEGPAFHITRRIRQLASQPPADPARDIDLLLAPAHGVSPA